MNILNARAEQFIYFFRRPFLYIYIYAAFVPLECAAANYIYNYYNLLLCIYTQKSTTLRYNVYYSEKLRIFVFFVWSTIRPIFISFKYLYAKNYNLNLT